MDIIYRIFYHNMKQLKGLDETIAEIEAELKRNPNQFLASTLERLKIYRDYEIDNVVKKIDTHIKDERAAIKGGFRGFGVS